MSTLFAEEVRDPAELTASALAVIDRAFDAGARRMMPLLSGGHDSHCACHIASQHPRFSGTVHHIDTSIGSKRTRQHVSEICGHHGWGLQVWKSPVSYQAYVERWGFPGPGTHGFIYARLKDRCVRRMASRFETALITGVRVDESTRRMGHAGPIKVGELCAVQIKQVGQKLKAAIRRATIAGQNPQRIKRRGKVIWTRTILANRTRIWTAPCHDWSTAEQQAYMDEHDLPRNPVKLALGMSGECFCGAFASPGELNRIRVHCPDVAAEIDRLAVIARECGKHDKWGERPPKQKGLLAVESGPLCSSCDLRAKAAGVLFV